MSRQETSAQRTPPSTATPAVEVSLRYEGKSYKTLAESLADISEITSSVQSKTGWKVSLDDVNIEVVSPRELNRRVEADHFRRTGVPSTEVAPLIARAFNKLNAISYYHGVIATYLPKEGAILINEQRLTGASKDAVKSTLHHEFTHAAQHKKYPKFIEALDKAAREYQLWSKHGGDFPKDEQARQSQKYLNSVQARMSLLEGQAVTLQRMFEDELHLVPELKTGVADLVLGLTHRFLTGMRHKVGQYIQGEEIFKRVHALGVHEVDELFKSPRYTDLVFGAENPKKQAM